jgi:hypothetical protein
VVLVQKLGLPVSKTYNMNATVGARLFAPFEFVQDSRKSIITAVTAQPLLTKDTTKKGRR